MSKYNKAIEIMKRVYHYDKAGQIHPRDIEIVFECLEEGEKYKKVSEEIESGLRRIDEIGFSNHYSFSSFFKMVDNIKQKYFPPVKKIMIVEIEGENKDLVKNGFNFLKTFLERNKDGFDCKYKIKEGD